VIVSVSDCASHYRPVRVTKL